MKRALLPALLLLLLVPAAGEAAFSVFAPVVKGDGKAYANPSFSGWQQLSPQRLLLKETPRVYATDPAPDAIPPAATFRSVQAKDRLYVLLEWENAAPQRDRPAQAPKAELRKDGLARAQDLTLFADAACCQFPERPTAAYPSPMMGGRENPVRIAYWKAGIGFSGLRGEGRQKVEKDPRFTPSGGAEHREGRWRVVFEMPKDPGFRGILPVSFAIWDGHRQQRNGRKFFTPWYDLELGGASR